MNSTYESVSRASDNAGSSLWVSVGAVVIGRNEGQRLEQCLRSLVLSLDRIVYVDSGSTDGSCELAEALGVQVVSLDLSVPFTAARARNEGIETLIRAFPSTEFVQVIDGDCAIAEGWLENAFHAIRFDPQMAVVCGQRRERDPDATIYNRLCAQEWFGPPGEIESCGGDALIRLSAWQQVHGYNPVLIAGEEPEMCVRLRREDWKIVRLADDMTWHDAAMTSFGQWWKRAQRAGHAYAEGYAIHGRTTGFRRKEVRSIVVWGGAVPVLSLAFSWWTAGGSVLVAAMFYARQLMRIAKHRQALGDKASDARRYAGFTILGKLPQLFGAMQYVRNRLLKRRTQLIEYK